MESIVQREKVMHSPTCSLVPENQPQEKYVMSPQNHDHLTRGGGDVSNENIHNKVKSNVMLPEGEKVRDMPTSESRHKYATPREKESKKIITLNVNERPKRVIKPVQKLNL